jgi:uncharacterized protein
MSDPWSPVPATSPGPSVAGPQHAAPAPSTGSPSSFWRRVVGPPQGRWGLGAALLCLGPMFALTLLNLWYVAANPDSTNLDLADAGPIVAWVVVVSVALPWIWLAGVPLVASWVRGSGWRRSYGWVTSWRSLWWGLGGGIATFIVIVVAIAVSTLVTGQEISSSAGDLALGIEDYPAAFVVFLLLVAFGAPFVEELAFRGLLWGAIVKRGWSPWTATIVAGVLFGAFHGEPSRLVALALGGIVLGFVRQQGGLSASMGAHAVVNVIGAVQLWQAAH